MPEDDYIMNEDECPHENTTEGVDDNGFLVEPAYDVCLDCGKTLW